MDQFRTIADILAYATSSYGSQEAFSYVDGGSVSFADTGSLSGRLRAFFSDAGIGAGDRVAILSENMPIWPVIYLSVTTLPAVVVPILPDFPPEDVANILDHAGVKILVVSRKLKERVSATIRTLSDLRVIEIEEIMDLVGDALTDPGAVTSDDTAAIIYTSGTTGHSKGVVLSHGNIASNVLAGMEIAGMSEGESMLSLLPLSHTYECTLGFLIPYSEGVTVYYLDRPASPTVMLPALSRVRPHLMLSVPLIIEKIVRAKVFGALNKSAVTRFLQRIPPIRNVLYRAAGKKLRDVFGGRLYFFGVGGAPLAPDVEQFLRVAKFPYAIGYGLTETAPLLAGSNAAGTRFRSTGPAIRGVELRLQGGEVQARGPNVMKGYYRSPELTAESFTEDGWFRTGDLGEFDKDGYLYIKGRKKSMILGANGENIYPEAIESVINQFRYVLDSLVLQKGAQLVAKVHLNYEELQTGAREILDEIRTEVNRRLGAFARISHVEEQVEPFEKTPTFKIKRYLYDG